MGNEVMIKEEGMVYLWREGIVAQGGEVDVGAWSQREHDKGQKAECPRDRRTVWVGIERVGGYQLHPCKSIPVSISIIIMSNLYP